MDGPRGFWCEITEEKESSFLFSESYIEQQPTKNHNPIFLLVSQFMPPITNLIQGYRLVGGVQILEPDYLALVPSSTHP